MKVYKHLFITGTSEISWKDAIVKSVTEAGKTIKNICEVKVLEQRAEISNNKLTKYFVNLDLSFVVDPAIKDSSTSDDDN